MFDLFASEAKCWTSTRRSCDLKKFIYWSTQRCRWWWMMN